MLFRHPELPGRPVRLGACMNLWPVVPVGAGEAADTAGARGLEAILDGLRAVTVPLRDRLAHGGPFGVGLWIPAYVARFLANDEAARARLLGFLRAERLDAFTFNAFPFGDFHRKGLKADVFAPTWLAPERAEFTRDVVALGRACAAAFAWDATRHLSVSTHTGGHLATLLADADGSAHAATQSLYTQVAEALVAWEASAPMASDAAVPVVLGLEPEPRSLAGDTRELVALWDAIEAARAASSRFTRTVDGASRLAGDADRASGADQARGSGSSKHVHGEDRASSAQLQAGEPRENRQRLGTCLDACHAAVEFESVVGAVERATARMPLAKLQYSSALRLVDPARDPAGFATLLAQDEPVYLHQVTGRAGAELHRAADLDELAREPATWRALDELRCHFHVPVDLESSGRLDTTADFARATLAELLANPQLWGTTELHVEIETYTWSLAGNFGERSIVDGIEAEYRHVIAQLEQAGWQRAPA